MRAVTLELGGLTGPVALGLLAWLTSRNEAWLQEHPQAPHFYDGAVYEYDPPGEEKWRDYRQILADGEGDCEDLASALSALLRVRGGAALRARAPDGRPAAYGFLPPPGTTGQARWGIDPARILSVWHRARTIPASDALLRYPGVTHVVTVLGPAERIGGPKGWRVAWDPSRDLGMLSKHREEGGDEPPEEEIGAMPATNPFEALKARLKPPKKIVEGGFITALPHPLLGDLAVYRLAPNAVIVARAPKGTSPQQAKADLEALLSRVLAAP